MTEPAAEDRRLPHESRMRIVERWRYLRTLLITQLESFEAGGLQMHSDDVDISGRAMARLRKDIAEFDALIAEEAGSPAAADS